MNRREALKALLAAVAGAAVAKPLEAAERIVALAEARLEPLAWVSINGAAEVPLFTPFIPVPEDTWTALKWRLASNPEYWFGLSMKSKHGGDLDLVSLMQVREDGSILFQPTVAVDPAKLGDAYTHIDDLYVAGEAPNGRDGSKGMIIAPPVMAIMPTTGLRPEQTVVAVSEAPLLSARVRVDSMQPSDGANDHDDSDDPGATGRLLYVDGFEHYDPGALLRGDGLRMGRRPHAG